MSKGLDGRQRDENGQIREKRGDTRVGTLRQEYGDKFAKGYRSDTKLQTVNRAHRHPKELERTRKEKMTLASR